MEKIEIKNLGVIDYDSAMKIMTDLHAQRVADEIPNTLLVLEHEPVVTKGRRLHGQEVPLHPELNKNGVIIREADRGGLLTYHGPGQIVVYFIVKFSDYVNGISDFVNLVENALLDALLDYGVPSEIKKDYPGVWVGDKKIASIGLRVSEGITRHGISLNISNDLDIYNYFNPCGLGGNIMTNLQKITGNTKLETKAVAEVLVEKILTRFRSKQSDSGECHVLEPQSQLRRLPL